MDDYSILLEKIEECRQEILVLSLTSLAAIESGRQLDNLLNRYQNAS
ncbi:aspartyl-phosphate phosphatase Spo0E family protein [Lentibacillus kapialis]|nr:aspartyl-phosphate phosphatase Spo0E family protein [Lentibacillus kapialis]